MPSTMIYEMLREIKGGNLLPINLFAKLTDSLERPESEKCRSHGPWTSVCYGGEFGPDLAYVAKINGLTEEEVVQIHSSQNTLSI